jgi:glucose dehydrogenase
VGRPHLTPRAAAAIGCCGGLMLLVAGVWFVFGVGWALIVAGIATVAVFLLLYDVDEPEQQSVKPRRVVR